MDGRIDYANQFWMSFTGDEPEQTLGWGWARPHPEDVQRVTQFWTDALQTRSQIQIDYRLQPAEWGDRLVRERPAYPRQGTGTLSSGSGY